jgi:hypothetical protein
VEPSEAADGRGFRNIVETRPTGIRGTGRAARPQQLPECIPALEGRRGKLRIQLKNASASYLATLSGPLPNWRWMEADLISDAALLDQTSPGGRPPVSGKHHKWAKLFLRVKPAAKKPK